MILLWILLALLLIISFLCVYCFRRCFYSSNRATRDPYRLLSGEQYLALKEHIFASTRRMEEAAFEPIRITSFDGLSLYGRYYHHKDGAPVKIIFHGYRSMVLRDSAGGYGLGKKLGFNVLAVDQRAHGHSDGHIISFGINEKRDCLSWVTYVNERFPDAPIVLSGLSMGATTVIMATDLPLPPNVVCVLADCPYSSPKAIIQKVCQDLHMPARLAYPFIYLSALIFGKFDLEECDAATSAAQSKIPIIIFHGEDDLLVPHTMSEQIYNESNGNVRRVTFPNAGHGLSYIIDPQRYEAEAYSFLKSIPQLHGHLNHI